MSKAIKDVLNNPAILKRVTRVAFDKIDSDHSNSIEVEELEKKMIQLAQEIGVPIPSKNDVKVLMGTIDTDGSGKIEFEEFNTSTVKEEKVKNEKPKNNKKLKLSFNEQREFDTIDDDIATLEEKIASLEESTAKYATDFTKLQEIMNEKEKLEQELEYKYERWEYLNNLAEEIANQKENFLITLLKIYFVHNANV